MSDEDKNKPDKSAFWKFIEETAKRADRMPDWMKGGTSEREQCDPKPHTHVATSGARKK
jgi:hypothetical protein